MTARPMAITISADWSLMGEVEGARTFGVAGATYDSYMGRYSRVLADLFADAAGVHAGQTAVDVGCGPGALTGVLVGRLGADAVVACDPSPRFVAECAARHTGVRVELAPAESIPFETGRFDHAMAQLVLHFVSEPDQAASEMMRVVRPGGWVSACVWDFEEGMEMLRGFWDAALELDPEAPDEARTLRFGRPGEIAELFASTGLGDVVESTLQVSSSYSTFDELWQGFLGGVGPAGAYCVSLSEVEQRRLHTALFRRFGSPAGPFTLGAVARCAVARVP
ncbi:MAG TPA: class I SAM-dependent methyltransferase [Ilumatobacteraceae bacterium]|nr:class I SAM-dependent methyltransferase [Ilumatobacteraceae bacterium]